MDKTQFIVDFVEGRISSIQFRDGIYNDSSFEEFFKDEMPIPPYTSNGCGIYLYLIERDFNSLKDLVNMKSLLSKYLSSKGITYHLDDSALKKSNLVSKAQPKWLYLTPDYIDYLLSEAGDRNGKELLDWLKRTIAERFICISTPPKWLQSPNWPIENNQPLIFIGQLDITMIKHDTSQVYVFYNQFKDEFKYVTQST